MGGFAAEREIFGEMSTGASNDLKEATKLARALVTQFGMSEKLGPMTFGETQELVFLGKEISTERNYSEEVAAEIDGEVKNFIDHAYKSAQKILKLRKKVLDKIAKTLIEKETLEQEEFYAILKQFDLKPIEI
jgi:cell division protease FtsH